MSEVVLDRRTNAYRDDLAASYLEGKVDVPKFSEGEQRQIVAGAAALRKEPRHDAPLETELLFGEMVTVYDEQEGWAWAQAEGDAYVGYLSADALTGDLFEPTHRVSALRTHLYPAADIKAPPLDLLSMNSRVAVAKVEGRFALLHNGRYAIASHLSPVGEAAPDYVAVAEWFLGAPYLWGGRTSVGLDCSALVQLALQAAGEVCPRDSDMQQGTLGEALPVDDVSSSKRGDLIFWKGHVGIVRDANSLLHANAHFMSTVIEPLDVAVARIADAEGPVLAIRRLG